MAVTPYPSRYTAQPLDLTLSALAELNTQTDTAPFFTDVDQAALMTITPLARSLLDDTTAAEMRATLEIPEGGGTPAGTPGTVAYFGASGTLTSESTFAYDATANSVGIGGAVQASFVLTVHGDARIAGDLTVAQNGTVLNNLSVGNNFSVGNLCTLQGLVVGTGVSTTDGTIQYTGSDFQGRKAGAWVSLTGSNTAQRVHPVNIMTIAPAGVGMGTGWPDAAATTYCVVIPIDTDYAGGSVTLKVYRRPGGGPTGTAKMVYSAYRFRDNVAYIALAAGTAIDFAPGDSITHVLTLTFSDTFQAGDTIRVDLSRNGADAADTMPGELSMDGIVASYLTYI